MTQHEVGEGGLPGLYSGLSPHGTVFIMELLCKKQQRRSQCEHLILNTHIFTEVKNIM